jgi:hypothetical protein
MNKSFEQNFVLLRAVVKQLDWLESYGMNRLNQSASVDKFHL